MVDPCAIDSCMSRSSGGRGNAHGSRENCSKAILALDDPNYFFEPPTRLRISAAPSLIFHSRNILPRSGDDLRASPSTPVVPKDRGLPVGGTGPPTTILSGRT